MKPAIIISIPLVWGVRNVVNSGLYDLLETECDVYIATPPSGVQDMIGLGLPQDRVINLPIPKSTRIIRILSKGLKENHYIMKSVLSRKIFTRFRKSDKIDEKFERKIISSFLNPLLKSKQGYNFFVKLFENQFSSQINKDFIRKINAIQPAAALSTSYVHYWEWPLFNYLQNKKIPTATHILSFDNLTSRGFYPFERFDHYYTWQQDMSDQLRNFYKISQSKIKITGTPQFDFHVSPSLKWDKNKTASKLGIDPTKPYIAYCANHYAHTPGESQLISVLIEKVREIDRFKDFQWVIRIHPLDDYSRWNSIFSVYPNVVISLPWNQNDNSSKWSVPNNDDLALLSNTLRHACCTVTIASTSALDSCVVDTPIICLGFHPDKGSEEDQYYHDVHYTFHYKPIVQSGAVDFVSNIEEFLDAFDVIVANPSMKRKEREKLKNHLCGEVDGNSANRIAEQFLSLVRQNPI